MKTLPQDVFIETKDFTSSFLAKNIKKNKARASLKKAIKKKF